MNDSENVIPERLLRINQIDRSDWTYEMYIVAGQEVIENKFFSQWLAGKLAHEATERWGDCTKFATDIGEKPNSILAYRGVYRKFLKADPDYAPDGFLPWGALAHAAQAEDPIAMVNKLADKNIRTIEGAHRELMTEKTGKVIPRKPKIDLRWNQDAELWDIHMREEDFENINWEYIGKKIYKYLTSLWNK